MSSLIRTIDVGPLFDSSYSKEKRDHVIDSIRLACEESGIFQIVNYGISDEVKDRFLLAREAFFRLSLEEKIKIKRTESNSRGYFNDELTKRLMDWKEGVDIGQDGESDIDGVNQWPEVPVDFKAIVEDWYTRMIELSIVLRDALAESLGLPSDFFAPSFKQHSSFLRLNYYPPCENPSSHLCISRHTDAGFLTILFQSNNVASLQVYNGSGDGSGMDYDDPDWILVPPLPGALTINIGDMCAVWSNGVYKPPLHRVLANRDKERFSEAFFYNPSYNTLVAPVSTRISHDKPQKYKPINWGVFRSERFKGDYADRGEEIQISHFEIRE